MRYKNFISRWIIKIRRYIFRQKFIPVRHGPLKNYLWTTASSYEYILGNYEDPQTLKTFLSWLKNDTVFYDIGSNIGFHALVANRMIAQGKIYSFEPMPMVRFVFEKHICLNKTFIKKNNIELFPFAIADKEKEVLFSTDELRKDGNTYIAQSPVFANAEKKIMVQCVSIDGLIAQGFAKPDIIKIDAEGAELEVLQGALLTLQTYKPTILLATHECHFPGVRDKCLQFLQNLGYEMKHTGLHNKQIAGIDDYIAIYTGRL